MHIMHNSMEQYGYNLGLLSNIDGRQQNPLHTSSTDTKI